MTTSYTTDNAIVTALADVLARSDVLASSVASHLFEHDEFKRTLGEAVADGVKRYSVKPGGQALKLPVAIRHSHFDSASAANELGIGRSTLQRLAARGLLKPVQVGGSINAYCRARVAELAKMIIVGRVTCAPQPKEADTENIAHLDAYQAQFGIEIPAIFDQADPREVMARRKAEHAARKTT